MDNNIITIDGTEYVRADSVQHGPTTRQIVVLQRGWIVVGDVEAPSVDRTVTIRNASVIREWGTTEGLGELALKGATHLTVLDPCGTVRAHELAVVFALDVVSDL